jgi:hypothetical protein
MQTSMGDTRTVGRIDVPALHSLPHGATVKDISIGVGYDSVKSRSIHHRIAEVYEQQDRERMAYLNEQIAAEPRPKKYSYKRKHKNVSPGQKCERCGKSTGLCVAPVEPVNG